MPEGSEEQRLMQLWEEAVELSARTGKRVDAIQEGSGQFAEFAFLQQNGAMVNIEDFARGRIKRIVLLRQSQDGSRTLWELSEWGSEIYQDMLNTSQPKPQKPKGQSDETK